MEERWERMYNYVASHIGYVECLRCDWTNTTRFSKEGAVIIAKHVYDAHALGTGELT